MAITKVTNKKKNGKKSVAYKAEVWIGRTKVATKTFQTQAAAHTWHDATKEAWANGSIKGAPSNGQFTFGDCIAAYVGDSEGFAKLKHTSQQSMEVRLGHFRKSPVINMRMSDFSDKTVDAWFDWILVQPTAKNPGRKNFRIELKYLSIMLNWYRNYRNAQFVVPIVKRHHKRSKYKKVQPRRKDFFVRPDEVKRWLNWMQSNNSDLVYWRLAQFLMLTGVRLGEACGVCWDQVDLDKATVYISRAMCWDQNTRQPYLVDEVKTDDSYRTVHLVTALVNMFREMRMENGGIGKVPVFQNKHGEYLKDTSIRKRFNVAFKALGLPWRGTRITRHTWATLGLMANDDNISKVQVAMGHSKRDITEIYAKSVAQADKSTVDNTAKLMGFE